MFGTETGDARRIVSELSEYMKEQGLVFSRINLEDSSPYAILTGKSSVGYRLKSKWDKSGIVFFCTKTDADNLSRNLGLYTDDNSSDRTRPYAVFVRDSLVPDVVKILKTNPLNVQSIGNSIANYKSVSIGQRANSYQNKYWDAYFPHVKRCLARDGYSNSDSNTETTVRDTFYLERKDSRDFLTWFENEQTVEAAKERVSELLAAAGRKVSSLKNDIKYYSRDIDYFAEFYRNLQGKSDINTTHTNSKYEFIKILKNKPNVSLMRNREDGRYYVKKEYTVYNEDVFNKLKAANIDGLPKLIEVEKTGNKLYTIEEYIQGYSLLEMMEKNGTLDERTVRYIVFELCSILKELHHMEPQLIHRDIKPSNIMLDSDSKVYLIDFNASKEVSANTSEDTVLYGTQYFAAPEQLIGYKASTPATDIFSLGATISYLLTGMYHSQLIAPGRYQKVLEKCVEMSPRDRYQSIEEFESAFLDA